jgi:hypothetical protein
MKALGQHGKLLKLDEKTKDHFAEAFRLSFWKEQKEMKDLDKCAFKLSVVYYACFALKICPV